MALAARYVNFPLAVCFMIAVRLVYTEIDYWLLCLRDKTY
jgi:hypothetical protein